MAAPNTIQDLIKQQLLLNPYFNGTDVNPDAPRPVPLITADDGDIENEVEKVTSALAGGLAGTILIPFGTNEEPLTGVSCPKLIIEIAFSEYVIVNRAPQGLKKKAYDAIRKVVAPFKPDNTGGLQFWKTPPPFGPRFMFTQFGEFGARTKSGKVLLLYRALFETTEQIS